MIEHFNPAWAFFLAALGIPLARGRWLPGLVIAAPLLGLIQLLTLPLGEHAPLLLFGLELKTLRLDGLSFPFALIFHLIALLTALYALHLRDRLQQVAMLTYMGATIGAVLAGDLITLFVYWELTALTSVFLLWAPGTPRAVRVGMRYLAVQVVSGVLLIGGAVLFYNDTSDIAFGTIGLDAPGGWMILLAFGIKCAFPLLHAWVVDAYPEATSTGTVVLSAFTTKLAVYTLARGFPGTELLVIIGATMAVFPILYCALENDLRRVMAYALISQLGLMVVGVGIGSELAINGAVAHAFSGVLYKALIFMALGAVLLRTGSAKASDLGGLYRTMPQTTLLCLLGCGALAALPLFSGYISKSPILSAAGKEQMLIPWSMLMISAVGITLTAALRIPYQAFFATQRGIVTREAPWHMRLAMGLTALLTLGLGFFPGLLYGLLPYPMDYQPYTLGSVVHQLQLVAVTALAFGLIHHWRLYPPIGAATYLDSDWLYRRLFPRLVQWGRRLLGGVGDRLAQGVLAALQRAFVAIDRQHGLDGWLARTTATSNMVLWVTVILAGCLLIYYR